MADERSTTVRFKADTSSFKKGTDEMVKELEKWNKKLVDNQYKQKESNKIIADANKELKKIQKQIGENGEADETQKKQIEELNTVIEAEKVKLSQLKTEQAGYRQIISQTTSAIVEAAKSEEQLGDKWKQMKEELVSLGESGVQMLTQKLLELGKTVISVGEQFTASMSSVGAISGATAEEMELLEQTAREYGATTKYTASEAADALGYMALAGWNTEQSISALGGVLNLAAASNMDLARASDIVTDYITAFGLSAEDSARFVDMMSYAMSNSNTNTEQLGEAYKSCAATAHSLGYSVEDTTAVLMTMANAGVKGGEAGTALNTVMTRLATNTKGCADELAQYGVEIYDKEGNMQSLASILEGIALTWDTLTQQQQANLAKMIAGTNQYSKFQTIMSGLSKEAKKAGSSFGDYTKALEDCNGTATDMADTMSDNLTGDLKKMESAFQELALKVYDDGEQPIRSFVQSVTKYGVPAIEGIIEHMNLVAPVFVGAAAAIGGYKAALAMTHIVQGVVDGINAMKAAKTAETAAETANAAATAADTAAKAGEIIVTEEATAAQTGLNAAMSANPIAAVISLIGLLVGSLGTFIAMTQSAANETDALAESTGNYSSAISQALQNSQKKIEDAEAEAAALETLKHQYDDLRNKENLTAVEKRNLQTVSKELADTFGLSTQELRDKNGQYKDLTKNIDDYVKSLKDEVKAETNKENLKAAYKEYNSVAESYRNAANAVEEQKKKIEELKEAHQWLEDAWSNAQKTHSTDRYTFKSNYEEYREELKKEEEQLKSLEERYDETDVAMRVSASNIIYYGQAMGDTRDEVEWWNELLDEAANGLGKLSDETDDAKTAEEELAKSEAAAASAMEEADKILNDFIDTGEIASNDLTVLNTALTQNTSQQRLVKQALKDLEKEYGKLNKEEEGYKDKLDDITTEMNSYQETIGTLEAEETALREKIKQVKEANDELETSVSSLRSALSSLASTYQKLNDGQKLDLDTIFYLCDKYPEFAGKLLDAANNADKQKEAIKALFEAKKEELIKTKELQSAEQELANEQTLAELTSLQLEKSILSFNDSSDASKQKIKDLQDKIANLSAELRNGQTAVSNYKKTLDKLKGINIEDYAGSSSNTSSSSGSSDKEAFLTWGGGEQATGATAVASRLNWLERMAQLDKISLEEQRNYLNDILATEQMTADESYQLRSKLKQVNDKIDAELQKSGEVTWTTSGGDVSYSSGTKIGSMLGWTDRVKNLGELSLQAEKEYYEKILREEQLTDEERYELRLRLKRATEELQKEEEQSLQNSLDLVKASYEKLVENRISALEKERDAVKKRYQTEINEIDKLRKKRDEDNEDAKRQEEIDKINARLRYEHMDELTRAELLRKKQDLLNEQAEVNYERTLTARKEELQAKITAEQSKTDEAIAALNKLPGQLSDYIAKLTGTQSAEQKAAGNSTTQNINIVQNMGGLSSEQAVKRFTEQLLKELGA